LAILVDFEKYSENYENCIEKYKQISEEFLKNDKQLNEFFNFYGEE
jgi:hypothetical protein